MRRHKNRPKEKLVVVATTLAVLFIWLVPEPATAWFSYLVGRPRGGFVQLIGHDLNGMSLQGDFIDGASAVSISFASGQIEGVGLNEVWLEQGLLLGIERSEAKGKARGHDKQDEEEKPSAGKKISTERFIGATFEATLDDGVVLPIRIDDYYSSSEKSQKHIVYYEVSYETAEGWRPLCGVDDFGKPVPAVAFNGRWDYSQGTETGGSKITDPLVFTFGCSGFVLAKCAEMGYAPWLEAWECMPDQRCTKTTLEAHHQACTRMMRADFCGNGVSYTLDGELINPYDSFGMRLDGLDWTFEAEWDQDGAICAARERIAGETPACMEWLNDPNCGDLSHFSEGALIFTEISH